MSFRSLYLIPVIAVSALVIGCSDEDHDWDHHHDHERVVIHERDNDHRGPDRVIVREEPGYHHDRDYDHDHDRD